MAREAVLWIETGPPLPFTVANATGIEKGALLKMTDLMTAIIHSGAEDSFAGVAASEKIASDGNIKLGSYRQGVFKMYLSGAVTVGHPVSLGDEVNYVKAAPVTASGSATVGIALETGTTGEQILVEVKPGVSANVS